MKYTLKLYISGKTARSENAIRNLRHICADNLDAKYEIEIQLAALFTATTPDLIGGKSVTDAHISTLTDSIVLLRYVESEGQIRRAITVLKMRGSMHEKLIREYYIDGQGMHIGEAFGGHVNLLTGGGVAPTNASNSDCVNWQAKKTTTS